MRSSSLSNRFPKTLAALLALTLMAGCAGETSGDRAAAPRADKSTVGTAAAEATIVAADMSRLVQELSAD